MRHPFSPRAPQPATGSTSGPVAAAGRGDVGYVWCLCSAARRSVLTRPSMPRRQLVRQNSTQAQANPGLRGVPVPESPTRPELDSSAVVARASLRSRAPLSHAATGPPASRSPRARAPSRATHGHGHGSATRVRRRPDTHDAQTRAFLSWMPFSACLTTTRASSRRFCASSHSASARAAHGTLLVHDSVSAISPRGCGTTPHHALTRPTLARLSRPPSRRLRR